MTLNERSNLVLAFAQVLFVNGQATDQIVAAAKRLSGRLGMSSKVMPRWGELQLRADDQDATLISQVAADPTGVDMDRVASTMRAIEDIDSGRLPPDAAKKAISMISRAAPAPTWLFALAAATGVLSQISSVDEWSPGSRIGSFGQ